MITGNIVAVDIMEVAKMYYCIRTQQRRERMPNHPENLKM